MSSILDHVEQSVPRSTVYGAMKGSPVFIGKYFREVNPSSNALEYNYKGGERKINFIVASPDKTIFHDMRSAYIRLTINGIKSGDNVANPLAQVSEPASNLIERIVIKMNGTVVEDISRFDYLTSAFKRTLIKRDEKNARRREGWNYIPTNANGSQGYNQAGINQSVGAFVAGSDKVANSAGDEVCIKLDMSGIMNVQQLLSGYYSPLEIELYIQDPAVSCQGGNAACNDIKIGNPRLCIDQIVMSPEYVSAFESALLSNSNAQGIQIPFSTYYTYQTDIQNTNATFWVRKPVRYLRSVYWVATFTAPITACNYTFYRNRPEQGEANNNNLTTERGAEAIVEPEANQAAYIAAGAGAGASDTIDRWQVSIGTKSYRRIEEPRDSRQRFAESRIFLSKAIGHYNDYTTETDELNPYQTTLNNSLQGIDLEYSPDNDVLASETTLNSNDIRLELNKTNGHANLTARVMVFLNYQASIALFPGNETRLLVT